MTPKLDKRNRGFTLIETLIVIAMSMTLMAISMFQLQPAMQLFRSRAAPDPIKNILRQGRELGSCERRSRSFRVDGNTTITLVQVPEPTNTIASTPFFNAPSHRATQSPTSFGQP